MVMRAVDGVEPVHRLRQTNSGRRRKHFVIEYSKTADAEPLGSPVPLLGRSGWLLQTNKMSGNSRL
jgi:hypothetical protein